MLSACLLIFVFAISQSLTAYELLVETIPIFQNQRIPQRSLFLAYLVFGVVVSAGGVALLTNLSPILRHAVISCALAALAAVTFVGRPLFPTLTDLAAIREQNPVLTYVRQDPNFFRITAWEDRNRHWSWEHQTLPYRIRQLLGYARLWHIDYMFSPYAETVGAVQTPFIPVALDRNYAFATGLMSVKYVASRKPLSEPGLELIEKFPLVRAPKPPKSRGPYLYRNLQMRPQAYRAPQMAAVYGAQAWVRKTSLHLVGDGTRFPFVLLEAGSSAAAPTLDHVELILAEDVGRLPARLRKTAGPRISLVGRSQPPPSLPVRELLPTQLSIPLGVDINGWIVLSEKFALFEGWRALLISEVGAVELPLLRANHVNSAVWIPPGEHRELRLEYRTPWLRTGFALLAATVSALVAFAWFARRRVSG